MASNQRYVLAKKINRGGMAEIYLGKQIGEDGFARICAIKRILPHYAGDKEFIEMFRDEAHICKRLQHANIVQVYDFEEVEDSYAIIMEYVDGADLRTLLSACERAKVRLSLPMALFITAEAARGLHYAHTKVDEVTGRAIEIVHRDISPQNILISYEGEIKVTDFGIADAENKLTETKPGIVKGKYSYMSPEQVAAKRLDARSDVFSLAIVLWEMLAMRRLFAGENDIATIKLVQTCDIPRTLHDINQDVDAELEAIVEKGLMKNRTRRFQSAAAFEKELRRYLAVKFPEFTAGELGSFLKRMLADKRGESQEDIKKTLTETNLKAGVKPTKTSVPLSLASPPPSAEPPPEVNFSLAKPRAAGGFAQNARPPGTVAGTPLSGVKPAYSAGKPSVFRPAASVRGRTKARSNLLSYVAVALVAVALSMALLFNRDELTAKDHLQFHLRSTPAGVQLNLDGKDLYNGAYKRTPLTLMLPPGKHRVIVSRQGYLPEKIDFEGEAGQIVNEDKLVLERDLKVRFAPLMVKVAPPNGSLHIDVDDGFSVGLAPRAVAGLLYGRRHTLRVYPDFPDLKHGFKCTFVAKATSFRDPYVVTIFAPPGQKPKCSAHGP